MSFIGISIRDDQTGPPSSNLRKSKKTIEFENVVSNINKGYKELIILRGLPGSGKSFLARKILECTIGFDANYQQHILSTDDYFYLNKYKRYEYDVSKLETAHKWNQSRAFEAVSRGFSPIIIDNTNTQIWEMKPYVRMASDFGYQVNILEPDTQWCFNDTELSKRNGHGVGKAKIREMMGRYERNVTLQKLLSVCKVPCITQPQLRSHPPVDSSSRTNSENGVNKSQATRDIVDVETLWGVSYDSLRSWDIVTPIEDSMDETETPESLAVDDVIETKEVGLMTENKYFNMFLGDESISSSSDQIKILQTFNRNINISLPFKTPCIPKVFTLEKGCMTDDFYKDYDDHISQLVNLFPAEPKSNLSYWYNKCKGDLEWTIEFLLEAGEAAPSLMEVDLLEPGKTISKSVSNNSIDSNSKAESSTIERSEEVKKSVVENAELKKIIESKIAIGEDHYSNNLLRIKKAKFPDQWTAGSSKISVDPNLPSTSGLQNEICPAVDEEDIIMIDSDMESDEFEIYDPEDNCKALDETIEINLGDHLVTQLENRFGNPELLYPKGLQPVVQVPLTLAKQLYTFYIESVYQQMENQTQIMNTLTQEDEEFAKKLQEKEKEELQTISTPVPNLREIMIDQQTAQASAQKEAEKWKSLNPDNLAAKLTQQKLFSTFPTVPQESLIEILYAHGNNYQETIETLIASAGPENIKGNLERIREPPVEDDVLKEMKEAKMDNDAEEYGEVREATFYREEASKYLKKREELYRKAQRYYQKGMREVAQFFSDLARSQTMYFERANSLAATTFLDEHSKRLEDFNTLDLHFLYVKEAIPSLDVFLDRNINLLRLSDTKQSEYLQVITGRGNRSERGISKIKPAVQSRLKQRKINYVFLNPGMMKVKVTRASLVTSEIPVL